jgi:ATP-dependent Clp protease adaptor protein ClpS
MAPSQLDIAPSEVIEKDTNLDVPYNVFLWNDVVNTQQAVSRILQKIFKISKDKADLLMITAHLEGKAVVWTGEREQAEAYCVQLHTYGLMASVAKDA